MTELTGPHHLPGVVELVTDYFEGALSLETTELFEQHVNFCEGCDWYVDEMRTTVATVGRMRRKHVPDEMRDRLLTAFRDWKGRS